jgi:hypothetical protein
MHRVSRIRTTLVVIACGLLGAGCAGVIRPDPVTQAAMDDAQHAMDMALAAHLQAAADAQRAADMAMAAAQTAAQMAAQAAIPVVPPAMPQR